MKLADYNNIHFIGIGGISMSSLAEILLDGGKKISGSDSSRSALTDELVSKGIDVKIGQKAENITDDIDLVVYTAAIGEDNPELKAARASKATVIDRAELVGMMMLEYSYPVSVAGTHGKTTTSSLVTEIFLEAEKDPTVSIGGILHDIGGNFRIGAKKYFVLETCEYCDSFLKFNPHSAIILNIDMDHVDYFKNLDNIYKSFHKFALRLPENGLLVINKDIERLDFVTEGVKAEIQTYGSDSSADWYAENISFNSLGHATYTVCHKGEKIAEVKLNIPGMHNVFNSLAAFALAYGYGIDIDAIVKGIARFTGTDRRFQYKGEFGDSVKVIDDYAHHPTEIKATISSAKANDINKLWIVFQPHTYTRTLALLDEFADALKGADRVVLLDIYASREHDTGIVSSKDLLAKLQNLGANATYAESFEKCKNLLISECDKNDMVITMGAGDVYKVGEDLVK
jgi:UDP-N-acetylmuramate--alanine ligase